MHDTQSHAPAASEQLRRVVGAPGYALLALNGVIGAGIFGLPAVAAQRVGDFSPWLFLLCALIIMTVVLGFARAASLVSATGGPIVYVARAHGAFAGFQVGWLLYISRLVAMAANTVLLVTYAAWFLPALESGLPRQLAIALVIAALTGLNIVGVRAGMGVVYLLSVFKVLPLLFFAGLGLAHAEPGLLGGATLPPLPTLGETLLLLIYAFVGFENAVIPAGEGRRPARDIPVAIIATVVLISLLYFLIQWVALSLLPELSASSQPLVDAASVMWGTTGATVMAVAAVASIAGNCSASVLGAPRLSYALSLEKGLPAWFGRVHPRFHTPANSIAFYGAGAILLAVTGSFVTLAVVSTLVRLVTYAAVLLSLPRLRAEAGEEAGGLPLPGGWFIPALGLLLCLALLSQASATAWGMALALAAIGTALYLFTSRRRA
ncbi:APC family permease [Parahaliea mediterranea]|uniref:Arginine/agmatine antiporter n=1 Tax=Parahaliea mediterranea TaxID=651086 RepID=A0A939DCF1_9GAMM|nr:APC family permease [Parahaliea mediterranea]MBN7795499.1 APC family permease [Parahaliea mediterranea]